MILSSAALYYLRPSRLPGTVRILHNRPMASFPVYVPPKLKSSATTKAVKRQHQGNKMKSTSNKQIGCKVEDRQQAHVVVLC